MASQEFIRVRGKLSDEMYRTHMFRFILLTAYIPRYLASLRCSRLAALAGRQFSSSLLDINISTCFNTYPSDSEQRIVYVLYAWPFLSCKRGGSIIQRNLLG
jgi:lauroyl/myristoyl acyltransferase